MLFSDDRDQLRHLYYQTWQKAKNREPLETLERQIAEVIADHPEYHNLLEHPQWQHKDYLPELGETNPFLHMGLHFSIREQVQLDRPAGIRTIFQHWMHKLHAAVEVEHHMMDCLVETLWQAQRHDTLPDEQQYLQLLKQQLQNL